MTENDKGAWFGDPELKAEVLARMIKHREDDEIIHGTYQELSPNTPSGYRGCLIGCTLPAQPGNGEVWFADEDTEVPDAGWHGEVERLYGIPKEVARYLDSTFERCGFDDGAEFAVASIEAIQPGADLSGVAERYGADVRAGDRPGSEALLRRLREAPLVVSGE